MRKIFRSLVVLAILFGLFSVAYAQESIKPEDAGKYIGQQKTVCGMVASAHYASRTKGQPTFLNLDKPYPNQILTVLIWGSDRVNFRAHPESFYSGKEVCVTGTIGSYRGRAEIVVEGPSQITVK